MGANLNKLSITHDQIMNWMLQNPGSTLAQCAHEFGYTVPWLSMVVNNDLFQERLREKQKGIDYQIAVDIPARMRGVASQALEKIARHVDTCENPDFLLETADKMLHRLGYAPSKAPTAANGKVTNIQQNVYVANKASLADARLLMNQVTQLLPPPEVPEEAQPEPLILESMDHVVTTTATPN